MNISRIFAVILLFSVIVTTVSALSMDELRNQLSGLTSSNINSEGINIKDLKTNQLTIQQTSEQTKQIALSEVNQKFTQSEEVPVIVWLNEGNDAKGIIKTLGKKAKVKYIYDAFQQQGFALTINEEKLNKLLENQAVDYVAFDASIQANLAQSRPLVQANIVETNTSYLLTGQGVGVCHLDTGVNYAHPNLAGVYAGGYDFINNDNDPMDDNGHGTATAGVIFSNHTTRRGMAPEADLLAIKVLDAAGLGSASSLIAGINWCIANKNQYNIAAISMSLGTLSTYTPSTSPAYADPALQTAYIQNIVPVASTGNDGMLTQISYPGVSPYVLPVTSSYDATFTTLTSSLTNGSICTDNVNTPDMISCFANRASFVSIVAPGAIISTTSLFGGLGNAPGGTSLAAPHVSGAIALMKQRNSQMTVEQIRNILTATGVPIYDTASGVTFKRLNILEAVRAVPFVKKTGTFYPGNVVNIEISDPMNPGNLYFALLSLGNTPGMPVPNGLTIPINPDFVFGFSIQPSPFYLNNIGGLDANGKATATLLIPNITGVETFTVHSSFITANASLDIEAIGNSITL